MSKNRYVFKTEIIVKSPVLCSGLVPAGRGIDISHIRDELGYPILPHDHMKGLIKSCLNRQKKESDEIDLGQESSGLEPNRSDLNATDFTLKEVKDKNENWIEFNPDENSYLVNTRIEINDETGTTQEGAMFFTEMIAPAGQPLKFEGDFIIYSSMDKETLKTNFKDALQNLYAVGANRSIDFGEVLCRKITSVTEKENLPTDGMYLNETNELTYQFTSDRPLMVDSDRLEENVFYSSAVVPGGAIKGMIANELIRRGLVKKETDNALAKIKISHAFPINEDGILNELPCPFSFVKANNFHDIFSSEVQGHLIEEQVPKYQLDWKNSDFEAAREVLKGIQKDFNRVQRTRIAIDESTATAEDTKLFVYQSYPAYRSDKKKQTWQFTINYENCENDEEVNTILSTLSGDLDRLGKTDAIISINEAPQKLLPYQDENASISNLNNTVSLTLITPTLILSDGRIDTHESYENYWQKTLGHPVKVECFARETLIGGYVGQRFNPGDEKYRAWILTQPGSSFKISNLNGDSVEKLNKYKRTGLPLPDWATDFTWKNCPFVPENGYGEFVNQPTLINP